MYVVNYDEIKQKLKEIYQNKIYLEQIIIDQDIKIELLSSFLDLEKIDYIDSFKQIIFDNITIFEFDLNDLVNNKKTSNLIIIKDNFPLIRLEHYAKNNYNEDNYFIYSLNSKRLSDKLITKSYNMNDSKHLTVSLLGKFSDNIDKGTYFNKKYGVYINSNKITAINASNNMYLENEAGFTNIIETFITLINKFYIKLNQKIDNLGDEFVKEYHIIRKK